MITNALIHRSLWVFRECRDYSFTLDTSSCYAFAEIEEEIKFASGILEECA